MDALTATASGQKSWNWPCLHLEAADTVDLDICWTDDAGAAYALPVADPGDTLAATLKYQGLGGSRATIGTAEATIAANHALVPGFDPAEMYGVYTGVVAFVCDDVTRLTLNCILSVKPDEFSSTNRRRASVTIDDVRMMLYDRLAGENLMEEDLEFPDRTIYEGMRTIVQLLQDTCGSTRSSSAQRFPVRRMLVVGAAGEALRGYRALLARNSISAPGQTSPEAGRLKAYAGIASELHKQFHVWLAESNRVADAERGWGVI